MKAKKKPRRRSDSSGGYTLSDIIQSPSAAGTDRHGALSLSHHLLHPEASLVSLTVALSVLSVVSPFLVKSVNVNSTESLQDLLTSDSEGSNTGAGSPRDVQSPVFHERAEVDISKTNTRIHRLYCARDLSDRRSISIGDVSYLLIIILC